MRKKIVYATLLSAFLLGSAHADVQRMGGLVGFNEIQEHSQEMEHEDKAQGQMDGDFQEQHSAAASSSSQGFFDQMMEDSEHYYEEATSSAQSGYENGSQEAHSGFTSGKEGAKEGYDAGMEGAHEGYEAGMNGAQNGYSTAMQGAHEGFENGQKEHNASKEAQQEHQESVMHLLEIIEAQRAELPKEAKEIAHELEKAVKFYKKPEFFEDINITSPADLTKENIKKLVEQRIKEAEQKRKIEVAEAMLQHKNKRELQIVGEFIKTGPGQYDWVFVTKSGQAYKLTGVNPENGNFDYKKLSGVQVSIQNGAKVQYNGKVYNGYPFASYDDSSENGFDWVVVTSDGKVYKLEGYDEESGSFVYTPVDPVKASVSGDTVVVQSTEPLPGVSQ